MRVVTTCTKDGLERYGYRWLEGMRFWPKGTEFHWYTEGYQAPDGVVGKDFSELGDFSVWKGRHAGYVSPGWMFNVVGYAHKVFAAADALYDYDGVGVWLDADVVTFKQIPEGLVEKQVQDAYLACYQRTGIHTETGMWIVNCADPGHKAFLDFWRALYLGEHYKSLVAWTDCHTLDAAIRKIKPKVNNLSGEFHKYPHPQAHSEFGQYMDHCKGPRKAKGFSAENEHHQCAR